MTGMTGKCSGWKVYPNMAASWNKTPLMTSDITAFLVTEATTATATANVGQTQDMCLVLVSMSYHQRALIGVVLMYGSSGYLTVIKGTMAGQFLNESLIQ